MRPSPLPNLKIKQRGGASALWEKLVFSTRRAQASSVGNHRTPQGPSTGSACGRGGYPYGQHHGSVACKLCVLVASVLQVLTVALLLLVLVSYLPMAQAQPVPATDPVPRVAFPMTHVGNVSTIGPRTADAANAARFSFGVASNGAIFADSTDRLPTPGGASIPIGVSGTIAKPNVAAALGRFARKALPLVSTGFALYDLGEELGFGLDNSSGSMVVSKPDPTACAANCYTYTGQVGAIPLSSPSIGSYAAAYVSGANSFPPPMYRHLLLSTDAANHRFYVRRTYVGYAGEEPWNYDEVWITPTRTSRAPDQASSIPSSVDEFVDAVAARSGWPSSSALARATVDAIRSGEALEVVPDAVTGPATSPGPSSQTVNDTLGQTTTSTVTNYHTYNGPQVTTTVVTNTTTTDNSTGAVVSTSATTTSPVITPPAGQAADETPFLMPCGVAGTPACSVKVDEAGMPDQPNIPDKIPELRQEHADQLGNIQARDWSVWESFRDFFVIPQLSSCQPIPMPEFRGQQIPSINACGVVGGVQNVALVVWVLGALAMCIGMVRGSI